MAKNKDKDVIFHLVVGLLLLCLGEIGAAVGTYGTMVYVLAGFAGGLQVARALEMRR